ncbi:DUF159 domain protein [Pseudovirgaria hyperparasitica]|uniref:DUF159 domain protein n=1 Tax=Pseudovirgaria hyperparasitica TaxID=470096 RepID=A0A6A6WA99_9PEZI|nr:DUF159 domain protein [Pseudovirgaria hyperparasitica]KAF2758517.1 DUF159 domain protein [Pseudovirgaria hyperparasitica]
MPSQETPADDEVRQTYNFAPGYFGLVYRADVPYTGAESQNHSSSKHDGGDSDGDNIKVENIEDNESQDVSEATYKLQAMKWGLVPFFTKRNPDYGSVMKTINCRDDSLLDNRGIWTVPKMRKRCVVVFSGFYEWLKKDGGKHKVPHFIKRKDGQLMCVAGLWDCVQYEGSDEKHYTYTIITTDSNKQLNFLHDRMPVVFDNGSDDLFKWLDPKQTTWTKDLQSLLKPYNGELECYPVSQEVGKVGNNSSKFIVPVDSAENKSNIANFFDNQKKLAQLPSSTSNSKVKKDSDEPRGTVEDTTSTEDNAPLPVPQDNAGTANSKRTHEEAEIDVNTGEPKQKSLRLSDQHSLKSRSPAKSSLKGDHKTRSSTTNQKESPATAKNHKAKPGTTGSKKITSFFGK